MSRFTVQQPHSVMPNSNEYMYERQFISINSEDRNIMKYPNSADFEIELPQDYQNVQGLRLSSWTFPSGFATFLKSQKNIYLTFKLLNTPNINLDQEYVAIIEEGSYTPSQMATELTNAMNQAVGNYNDFVVVYNEVSGKLWFGNKTTNFILTNNSCFYNVQDVTCNRSLYPDYSNWGLPSYLGFLRENLEATAIINPLLDCNFNYTTNGPWLTTGYYLAAQNKVNLLGNSYIYMEIDGLNNIDETIPYSLNEFTQTTNMTNGVVKASFAKISIIDKALTSQWFDDFSLSTKIFNPPAERIRKLKIKLRYHNGALVDFGNANYSIMLEFTMFRNQNAKRYHMYIPETYKNLV
jgi:hypothetical protein